MHKFSNLSPICIIGPTATGKTALALQLGAILPCEIISVDSTLVYKRLDIGSAKPSLAEQAEVQHHLIDVCEPWEPFSVAEFAQLAHEAILQCQQRGRIPLLVGGSPLYFKALLFGLNTLPTSDPTIRSQLMIQLNREGLPPLYERLKQYDAPRAAQLHPNDSQRILRALEIFLQTGKPMSQFLQTNPLMDGPVNHALTLWLLPPEKKWLHERIALRFDQMLKAGFQEEVEQLRAHPQIHGQLPAMRSVGYRQMLAFLSGACSAEVMRTETIQATCQLFKRQMTWYKAWPHPYQAFDCTQLNDVVNWLRQNILSRIAHL